MLFVIFDIIAKETFRSFVIIRHLPERFYIFLNLFSSLGDIIAI